MNPLKDKILFKSRSFLGKFTHFFKWIKWKFWGAKIAYNTYFQNLNIVWPHQIQIGNKCTLEGNIILKYDGIWSSGPSIIIGNNCFVGNLCEFNIKGSIEINDNCLIGSGSKFIDHDHGMDKNILMCLQECPTKAIYIAEDVWIGVNVVILKGVNIGKGAVVAAGAVVNKDIPTYEIWGGIPARKIGSRI